MRRTSSLDSEPDGLPDAWEIGFFGNTAQGNVDSDGDGQINSAELLAGSNPASITSVPGDADGDGLGDAWEFTNFGSFAATPGGDPDGDRDTNAVEFANDTNPVNKESFFSATADTVPDSWKAFYNISAQGSLSDLDEGPGDGIDNRTEFVRNTNPTLRDTDGDGLDDGIEVNTELTDPLDTDTDDDGLSDGQEVNTTLTEPLFSDTDGDSFGDNYELTHASDPLLASSTPVQPTGFALLEDFDGPGMVAGQSIQGVNGWVASDPGKATVVADPADADHELQWANGNLSKSISSAGLAILNGNTGTLFFQMHCETAIFDRSFGLSDVPNPAGPGDFEAQVAPLAGNIRVRNAAATPDTTYDIPPMQWMNVWIVTNNNTDTVKVFMETPAGQVGKIELTAAGGPYVFRNGAAANALISLCLLKFEVPESKILIDNLYVDAKAENLNNPLSSAGDGDGDGLADAWETTYFNGLGEVAAGDFDKDGTDNITEFRLGLIPNSGSSRFAATRQGNGSISWPSTAGTTFKIERSVNLGAGGWSVLQAAYPGTAVSTSYTDPAPPPTGKAFYRVTLN
ncbi:hypothetical protein [Luteolibacter sp. Populi]|uniref:hypothetical protein n=1 Tax=Luteolibacter sp. Populi TaxID=3230487 RepID=UPI003467649A